MTAADTRDSTVLGGPPYRRAVVVANPISGRGQGLEAAREIEEGLRRVGVDAERLVTAARGDAFTRLRSLGREIDLVVAVGGDGTLREVLEGLVDPETPVGLLPFGTANVLARELGLPRDVHHALEILLRRRVVPIDVMTVNGKLSFLVTGIGIDAAIVREVEAHRRGPIRMAHYYAAALRTLPGYRPPVLRVEIDGEPLEGTFGFVMASNTTAYAGRLRLAADARMDDGLVEVYLLRTGRVLELVRAGLRGLVHRWPGGPVTLRRARALMVRSDEPVPVQIDGDLAGTTPLEAALAPNQYRLIVP